MSFASTVPIFRPGTAPDGAIANSGSMPRCTSGCSRNGRSRGSSAGSVLLPTCTSMKNSALRDRRPRVDLVHERVAHPQAIEAVLPRRALRDGDDQMQGGSDGDRRIGLRPSRGFPVEHRRASAPSDTRRARPSSSTAGCRRTRRRAWRGARHRREAAASSRAITCPAHCRASSCSRAPRCRDACGSALPRQTAGAEAAAPRARPRGIGCRRARGRGAVAAPGVLARDFAAACRLRVRGLRGARAVVAGAGERQQDEGGGAARPKSDHVHEDYGSHAGQPAAWVILGVPGASTKPVGRRVFTPSA